MREILFKAKRLDNGEWVEGYLVKHPSAIQFGITNYSPWYIHRPPVDPDDNGGVYNIDPETVCQYIGLSDKNKKKIFEGDILQYFDNEMQVVEWSDEYGQMMLHTYSEHERKKGRKVVKEMTEGWNYLDDYPLSDMPILGNIFDNPELLEVRS